MIKKILPVSIFLLLVVLVILFGIQNMLSSSKSQGIATITPTLVQGKNTGGYSSQSTKQSSVTKSPRSFTDNKIEIDGVEQMSGEELQRRLPVYAPNFTLEYSPRMQRYIVTTVNDEGASSYEDWIAQNPSYVNELQNAIITKQTVQELHTALDYAKEKELTPEKKAQQDIDIFTSTINSLFNLPFLFIQSFPTGEESPSPTPSTQTLNITPTTIIEISVDTEEETSGSTTPSKKFTYYSQCSGPYDEKPLPNGCTVCNAGCGPTSVAMILSSYVDSSLNPIKTIDLMDKAGVKIGCYGSYISEIYSYLKGRGDIKVSDFIIPSEKSLTAKEVVKDFDGYIKSGWTIFVLANFKTNGGGHYFWVTNISEKGDILAYDPYYGKQQSAPINENRYTPAPYYRYAFAVKKS